MPNPNNPFRGLIQPIPPLPPLPPLNLSFPRRNIDDPFDDFMGVSPGGTRVYRAPFTVSFNASDTTGQILESTASYLHENYLAASGLAITGLNDAFDLTSTTHAWIEVAIDTSIAITAVERKTGSAFPELFISAGTPAAQTKYNIPIGRVVDGAQPGMPGFDFKIGSTVYHWQQLLREHQIMEGYCFSGVPGLKAFPWQGV